MQCSLLGLRSGGTSFLMAVSIKNRRAAPLVSLNYFGLTPAPS
jgi:hypothetical protein